MQNHRLPSFFLTKTTALHQALWLGQIAPDSNISCRWLWTSLYNGKGICLNLSLKGVSSVTFIVCSMEWVQPNPTGSNENTSWYLAKSQWAASTTSGAHESNPLKSNSSNNLPCIYLTVSLGVWGLWGSSPPSCKRTSSGGLGTGNATTALAMGFSFGECMSKVCCSLPPQLPLYFLASIQCMCFVQWGPVAKSHLQSASLAPWCWYILQYGPFPPLLAPHARRRALWSPHSGWTLCGHSHLSQVFHNAITYSGIHPWHCQGF